MDSYSLKINEHITLNKGVTPDEGEIIFQILSEQFSQGNKVILDFTGVEMMTTAFLNVAIGNLYKTYNSDQLKEMMEFNGLTESIAMKIKQVTDAAKLFYLDEEKFSNIIDKVLNEND